MKTPYGPLMDRILRENRILRDELIRFARANDWEPEIWAWMRCTVGCDLGRGSGKTTYINQVATEEDLVVTQTVRHQREYSSSRATVLSARQITHSGADRGRTAFRLIFIEHPDCVFSQAPLDKLRNELAIAFDHHTFILLG